ncbi:MAG: ECF transporter S component [Thermoproteota archaeon]|jgi:riboflavin transporter FmnP
MLSRTRTVVTSAFFGALAAVMAIAPLSFPFPLVPYLKFDLAEIPTMISLILLGPLPGILTSLVYWIVLNFFGSFAPIGPFLKFLAVLSTIVGAWIGTAICRKMKSRLLTYIVTILVLSAIVRVVVLTLANYFVIWVLMPDFLSYATFAVSLVTGIKLSPNFGGLLVVLLLTAVFNTLHVFLTVVPSFALAIALVKRKIIKTWFPLS